MTPALAAPKASRLQGGLPGRHVLNCQYVQARDELSHHGSDEQMFGAKNKSGAGAGD